MKSTKMYILASVTIVLVGVTQITAVCYPHTNCRRVRDTIIQLDSNVTQVDKKTHQGRSWYIGTYQNESSFNAILAFKNFSTSAYASVLVISYKTLKEKSTKYFYGDLGNFEVAISNVIGVIIYVPINTTKTADFVLNYYTDCDILTSTADGIKYPPSHSQKERKCWFIKPTNHNVTKRIYFRISDVELNEGQQITIWDVHSSQVITTATNRENSQLIGSETNDYQSVLIDLICTEATCDTKFNSFYITYHGMTQEDVDCIKKQSQCEDSLSDECNITCTAFDNMLAEEYGIEENTVIPRSGRADNATTKAPKKKFKSKCPILLKKKFCQCPASRTGTSFCKKDCLSEGGCAFACIYHQVATCMKFIFLKSTKLF